MKVQEFIKNFRNHPIMFVGTGLSLRYLSSSYSWENLLRKIALELNSNEEYYLDIKSNCMTIHGCDFSKVAIRLEQDFNKYAQDNRSGKFKHINDIFYENMKQGTNISRFKLYVAELLKEIELKKMLVMRLQN